MVSLPPGLPQRLHRLAAEPLAQFHLIDAGLFLLHAAAGSREPVGEIRVSQGQPLPLTPVFPADCRLLGEPQQLLGPRSLVVRSTLQCGHGLRGQSIAIDGLPASATEVLLRWKPPAQPGAPW
jgi:hypothetical protein